MYLDLDKNSPHSLPYDTFQIVIVNTIIFIIFLDEKKNPETFNFKFVTRIDK